MACLGKYTTGDWIVDIHAIHCSSTEECRTHNPEVAGSTPVSVTYSVAQLGELRAHDPCNTPKGSLGSIPSSVTVPLTLKSKILFFAH